MTAKAIEDANVIIYYGLDIIYKTTSDSAGNFKIPVKILNRATALKIHALNYSEFQFSNFDTLNTKDYYLGIFKIIPQAIVLKEVKIKSTRRYRDTTTIDLSKKTYERSIMINDLFSGSLGFTKDSNGQLYYKGKRVAELKVNGIDFFGKNNMDIYNLLPALILKNIKIIETNIDSTTNTTLLQPTIKIDLDLKDKYNKGAFGNANLGIGTADRYMANTDLYTYKKKEQISLSLNSNNTNTGDDALIDPTISFSPNGNNITTDNAKLTYSNIFDNKIQIDFSLKGKIENRSFTSISDLQEEGNSNQFSRTFNSSNSRSLSINNSSLSVKYQIDSLNTLAATSVVNYLDTRENDSLNYEIKLGNSNIFSDLGKIRNSGTDERKTNVDYSKMFASKKGRLLNIQLRFDDDSYFTKEFNNVLEQTGTYYINGHRSATENQSAINITYTEPINDNAYINVFTRYKNDPIQYKTNTLSDTTVNGGDVPASINNEFYTAGFKARETLKRVSMDVTVSEDIDRKNITADNRTTFSHYNNLDFDVNADYKINTKKDIAATYSEQTDYPEIAQLTSLNNTFDIVAQTIGNLYIAPERKKSLKLNYSWRESDSKIIRLSGEWDHFNSKFGLVINTSANANTSQNTYVANIGDSNSGQLSFSLLSNIFNNKYINFNTSFIYQETPTLLDNKLVLNNGILANQSVSISFSLISTLLTLSPILSGSYDRFFYAGGTIGVTTLTYSDKISLNKGQLQFQLYPLLNYNHNIGSVTSFSMNAQIKKSIFKDYGEIWLQGYDIFNSFKYLNNTIGGNYTQSIQYSNINRYFLLGISFKFNNMK